MISVICCSRHKFASDRFIQNINETVGETFELICIANHETRYTIAEAYNKGATLAKFPYLCFVHEDVLFNTKGWGCLIVNLLSNESTGVIGVAGGIYKSKVFSPAWFNFYENGNRINILQASKNNEIEEIVVNPFNEIKSKVVTLDGVFMCCRKSLWEKNTFDEKYIRGFHYYDMDFSLGIFSLGYINYVIYNISIVHFSSGTNDAYWYKEGRRLHNKWRKILPLYCTQINSSEIAAIEFKTLYYAFNTQLNLDQNLDALKSLCGLIIKKPFNRQNLLYIKKYLNSVINKK